MHGLRDRRLMASAALALVFATAHFGAAWAQEPPRQAGAGYSVPERSEVLDATADGGPELLNVHVEQLPEERGSGAARREEAFPRIGLPEVRTGALPDQSDVSPREESAPQLQVQEPDKTAESLRDPVDRVGALPGQDAPEQAGEASKEKAAEAGQAAARDRALASGLTIDGVANAMLANLPAEDVAVAEKLREMLSGKVDRTIERKRDQAAIQAFYFARAYAPLWVSSGVANARAKAAIARLHTADNDGLDPADYAVTEFKAGNPDALARAELRLVGAALDYARHAQGGRVLPNRLSSNMDYKHHAPEPADVLAALAAAKDVAAALDAYNPPHAGFQALRAKLIEARGRGGNDAAPRIASGPVLKVGMEDERVPVLRQRLHLSGSEDTRYDAELAEAVKRFQSRSSLPANGALTAKTVELLNGVTKDRQIDVIASNMERWRWLPRDLGRAYVMVNVPDYTLKVVRDGETIFRTRIVAGKTGTPTPIFSDEIENIVVNPTWHVPESIIYGEYLPALQQDPGVLARMGLVVERGRDGRVTIRQPPSERNALGRIKFNFPNRFNVYLHDTPDKRLFAHDRRAYSHGCMRVQNPAQFAEVLMSVALPKEGMTAERVTRLFGAGERSFRFGRPIPVHITYQNAYVDEQDKLVIREDIYGYDSRVVAALKSGDERRFADSSQGPAPRREASNTIIRNESAGQRRTTQQRQASRRVQRGPEQPQQFSFPLFRFFQ